MKLLLATSFLTLVCFSMNSWGADAPKGPGSCNAKLVDGNLEPTDVKCNDGFHPVPKGGDTVNLGNGNTKQNPLGCDCLPDDDRTSQKDLVKQCNDLQKTYGTTYQSALDKSDQKQKDAQDSVAKLQNDINSANETATEKIQDLKEKMQKAQADFKKASMARQKESQKETMSVQDQMRKQALEITKVSGQLDIARNAISTAQATYTAVANANNVQMIRMKCMSIIRKWQKENGSHSTITGGSGNMGAQQSMANEQWNACIATEQANAQSTISQAAGAVLQAQNMVTGMEAELKAMKESKAQMSATSAQAQQMQQQESSDEASQFQQQMQSMQENIMTLQKNAQQKINTLNQQALAKSRLGISSTVNKALDGDLNGFKSSCCDGDKPKPGIHAGQDAEAEDDETGGGMCAQKTTAQNYASDPTMDQLKQLAASGIFQSIAPGLLQGLGGAQ